MAISNRDLDVSQQRQVQQENIGAVPTASTKYIYIAPGPQLLEQIKVSAQGVSNAMTLAFSIDRFIAGSGITNIAGGATTLTLQNVSVSGIQSFVLATAGSTLLQLQANDLIKIITAVANGNATELEVSLVVKALQDIQSYY